MAFRLYSSLQLVYTLWYNILSDSDIFSALIYVLTYVLLKKAPHKSKVNSSLYRTWQTPKA